MADPYDEEREMLLIVMAGLDPAIHLKKNSGEERWMPGSSPGMTRVSYCRPHCHAGPIGVQLQHGPKLPPL